MTQATEVSFLLLDSVVQSMERMIGQLEEDQVDPDDLAVLTEVRGLLIAETVTEETANADQEESPVDPVEEESPADPVEA